MSDFEIESDGEDDESFTQSISRQVQRSSAKKSTISTSKPSKSFFGGSAEDRSNNNEDVYNFNIDDVDKPKKSYSSTTSSMQGVGSDFDSGFIKSSKVATRNATISSESALEKAQNMLRKYDTIKSGSNTTGSDSVVGSPKRNAFSLKKPSESFDEDDISLDSNENDDKGLGLGSRIGAITTRAISGQKSFDDLKPLYGSPLLGSFNKDEDDSSVGGLRSFGRFDSVDQMNIHQKLYDFNGENDDDFSIDLSDTRKEKMKEDPIIISKNQKSKAPSPVFVIADNMNENLLKFMNKNKIENSSPKNVFLEESHASQISSENYGNHDDGEAEEYVGGQSKQNNLSSRDRSQNRFDDNNDDDFETVNKKKEVEKTNKNQFQKISGIGLNDNSIEEDDDNYDDDNYNDNDRYSIDDKENENEDESNDFEPPEKFKISSFSGWTDETESVSPITPVPSSNKETKSINNTPAEILQQMKGEEKKINVVDNNFRNNNKTDDYTDNVIENEVEDDYEDDYAEDEDYDDEYDEPVHRNYNGSKESGGTMSASGDATPHSALTPRTTVAPSTTYTASQSKFLATSSQSPRDSVVGVNPTLKSMPLTSVEAVTDRLQVSASQTLSSSAVPSKVPFVDIKKASTLTTSSSFTLSPRHPLPSVSAHIMTSAPTSLNEAPRLADTTGEPNTAVSSTILLPPFYSTEPAILIPVQQQSHLHHQYQQQRQQQSSLPLYPPHHPLSHSVEVYPVVSEPLQLPPQPQAKYQVQPPSQLQSQSQNHFPSGVTPYPYIDVTKSAPSSSGFPGYPPQGPGQGPAQAINSGPSDMAHGNTQPFPYPHPYPYHSNQGPYQLQGHPLHSSMQFPLSYPPSPYGPGHTPHNPYPYPYYPYGHPYGNVHSLSYPPPQYAPQPQDMDAYLQQSQSIHPNIRSSFSASSFGVSGMGLGSQIPPYQSQSRNSFMESTGRSGLGLSYNVRTGSGIAGERGREIGDPVVQDLLLSLREAKDDAVWAKARLSEMISLLNDAKEDERDKRINGSNDSFATDSPMKSKNQKENDRQKHKFSSQYSTDEEDDKERDENENENADKHGRDRNNDSSSDTEVTDSKSEDNDESGDDEIFTVNEDEEEEEVEDEEYSLDFDETPQKIKKEKEKENLKVVSKLNKKKKSHKDDKENNENFSERSTPDTSKMKSRHQISNNEKEDQKRNHDNKGKSDNKRSSNLINSKDDDQVLTRDDKKKNVTGNNSSDFNRKFSNSENNRFSNGRDSNNNLRNSKNNSNSDGNIGHRADSKSLSSTSHPALFDMSSPLLTSQALFRQQLNNLRERMDMAVYSSAPSPFTGWSHKPHTPSPSLAQVKAQFERSRVHASLQLWEVIMEVDGNLSEKEAKKLAEKYNIIQ